MTERTILMWRGPCTILALTDGCLGDLRRKVRLLKSVCCQFFKFSVAFTTLSAPE